MKKFAAAGRFPVVSSREARPSDSRSVNNEFSDRVLRPLFPDDYHAEVQVMIS
jgi:polyribonucleotide nucleotidyltransferase